MERQLTKPAALSLALVILIAQAFPAYCCGPFFPVAIYSYWNHPDLPLKKFAQGNLGILQTSLANSYLVVAYRYLSNLPLDPSEQNAVVGLWHQRLSSNPENIDTKEWLAVRNTIPGVKKMTSNDFNTYANQPGDYQSYQNCSQSAFHTAATTLKERINKYGIDSKDVRLWVENQDQVFQNCGGEKNGNVILPQNPGANADKLAQQDFAYQTAAANFYAGKLGTAKQQFEQIATDKDSPWHNLAAYLQARAATREIALRQFTGNQGLAPYNESLEQTEALVNKLLADKSLAEYHDDLQVLADQLKYRSDPMAAFKRLSVAVLQTDAGSKLQSDLDDYTTILDVLSNKPATATDTTDQAKPNENASNQAAGSQSQPPGLPAECLKDDLTDWLTSLKSTHPDSAHIIDKWKSTKSMPWLIAALIATKSGDSVADTLVKEGQAVPSQSPAYLSAQYYSLRLLADLHKEQEARDALDQLLTAKSTGVPPSSRNMLLALRQKLASDLNECIGFGLKQPSSEVVDPSDVTLPDDFDKIENQEQYPKPLSATFDDRMAEALNDQLPLSVWTTLSNDNRLPSKQHNEVVAVTWMRAILLGNNDLALKLTPAMEASYPTLKSLLSSFQTAQTPTERRFAACYIMLKAPGLSPYLRGGLGRTDNDVRERDDYGDNFWIPPNPDEVKKDPETPVVETGDSDPSMVKPDIKKFLSAKQQDEALKEKRTMYATSSPPRFITEGVLAWSKESPNDPRLPEALFRSVKMPRWGCRVPGSTQYSKAAYNRLHSEYPSTSWAKKAEYYY